MTIKRFILRCQHLLLLGVWCLSPVWIQATTPEEIEQKRTEVAMRLMGHELLKCWGDSTSRILPIEQIDRQYQVSFESEFGFDPDDIFTTINRVMMESRIAPDYLVEMVNGQTQEVVHSFVIRNAYPDMIPCTGRSYPKSCYQLHLTILDSFNYQVQSNEDNLAGGSPKLTTNNRFSTLARFLLPLLGFLGLVGFFIKRNKRGALDPNLILIGASTFDTKNRLLLTKDQQLELSNKEAELLTLLHTELNKPLEREVILQKVWGDEGAYIGRTLDVFISKLRKKFEADESVKIVNIRGVGYKLVTD